MDFSRVAAILLLLLSFYVLQSNPNTSGISEMSSFQIPNTVATPPSSKDPENTNLPYSEIADTVTSLPSSESTKSMTITLSSSVTTDILTSPTSSESTQTVTSHQNSERTQNVTSARSESPQNVTSPHSSESTQNVTSEHSSATTHAVTSEHSSESPQNVTSAHSYATTHAVTSEHSSESPQNVTSAHSSATTHAVTSEHSSESTQNVTSDHSSESTQNVTSAHSSATTHAVTSEHSSESTQNVTSEHSSESTHNVTSAHSSATTHAVTSEHSSESPQNVTSAHSSATTHAVTSPLSSESTKNTTSQPSFETTNTVTTLPISKGTSASLHPANASAWLWISVAAIVLILGVILIGVSYWYTSPKHSGYEILPDNNRPTFGRGLRNLGNTCYFNAAIQCLVSTPILKSQVERVGGLTKEYLTFLEPIIDPENGSVSTRSDPQSLLDAFREKVPRFRGPQQQDCHELLRNFLDQMRKEERAVNPSKKLTAVDRVFGGHFMTIYMCKKCDTPYHICEPFLDISVPICRGDESELENSDQRQKKTIEAESATPYQEAVELIMERLHLGTVDLPDKILSIKDSFQYFTRQEMLGPQYLCKSCASDSLRRNPESQRDRRSTSATKQTLIFNPPAVLVIHLKRFEMKNSGFEKRTNKVKFEEVLDLGPYCSSWCQRNEDREQNIWYSLYAVVVHSGSLTSGHYVTYVKERSGDTDCEKFLQKEYLERDMTADELIEMTKSMYRKRRVCISSKHIASQGNWYCLNDSKVSRVSVDEVLRKEAFLLFYERV